MVSPILVGAQGRVARLLRPAWHALHDVAPVYVSHAPGPGIDAVWAPGMPPPPLPGAEGRAAVVMNGVTPRGAAPLEQNLDRARTGIDAARASGAVHVFVVSSSAVYGDTGDAPAAEDATPAPAGAYGRAKLALERDTAAADVTALRLANVAGASQPFDNLAARAAPCLHRFDDGEGPSRSFVGPLTLAWVLSRLCALAEAGRALPAVLNLAAPQPVAMAAIFAACGTAPAWTPAPPEAIRRVHLDTSLLQDLVPMPVMADAAAALVAEARAAGWPR